MAKYGVAFDGFATTTSAKSAVGVHADAAGDWFEAVEFAMTGSGVAAAADRQHRAMVAKCTFGAAGTAGSSPTPEPFDDRANASRMGAGVEYSAEPTTVGSVFPVLFGFNQRGGLRWAVPLLEGVRVYNANTNKGLVFQVISDAAGAVDGHAHWHEP